MSSLGTTCRVVETRWKGNWSQTPMNLLMTCSNIEATGRVVEESDSCVYFSFIALQAGSSSPPLACKRLCLHLALKYLSPGIHGLIDFLIWSSLIPITITLIFKITIGSLSVMAREESTSYRFESIPILCGCPSIEPCAFLAFFFFFFFPTHFSVISVPGGSLCIMERTHPQALHMQLPDN